MNNMFILVASGLTALVIGFIFSVWMNCMLFNNSSGCWYNLYGFSISAIVGLVIGLAFIYETPRKQSGGDEGGKKCQD
ncbi:MAG: hypothetical protein JSW41_04000 [Candidatus Aenigmatarchaeota archaeon]|nr:MAG: hypothetical protein JSW41_04000 [Candidatus Aenigmarchaeota archaeon]